MDYSLLHSEIINDPNNLGYSGLISIGSDKGIADLLNYPKNEYSTINPEVSLQTMLIWGATGPFNSITNYSENPSGNIAVKSICLAALNMFNAGVPTFHLNDKRLNNPAGAGMLQILEMGGVISSGDLSVLNSYTVVSGISRAEVLFGLNTAINPNDISKALRGY